MKLHTNSLEDMGQCCFSQILDILIWWRHGGHLKHFIYRTLTAVIFVRFVQIWTRCFHPVFAIENQQNRLVTSGFITNRAYFFVHFLAQKGRHNQNVFFFHFAYLIAPLEIFPGEFEAWIPVPTSSNTWARSSGVCKVSVWAGNHKFSS